MENYRNLTEDEKRTLIQDIIGAQQVIQEEDDKSKTITEINAKVNVDIGPLYELASKVSNMISEAFYAAAMHMNKVTNNINDNYVNYLKNKKESEKTAGEK